MKHFLVSFGLLCCLAGCSKGPVETANRARQHAQARDVTARAIKVYPYSLIPGGVETEGEFAAYRRVDTKLAEHYRDLRETVAVAKLPADKWMYASYRTADGIYWTKKRLLIHAGESVLTDGAHLVRARCGNRLAETAQAPIRKFEPPLLASDQVEPDAAVKEPDAPPEIAVEAPPGPALPGLGHVDRPATPRSLSSGLAPPGTGSAQRAPSTLAPGSRHPVPLNPGLGTLVPVTGRGVSTLYVPEAGSGSLLLIGLAVMAVSSWFMRLQRKRSRKR